MTWMIFRKTMKNTTQIKKRKMLIVFDDIIAYMFSNKKLNPIVNKLFIRGRKLNISFVFITQSYFTVSKNIILNSNHYVIIKIPNKWKLQQISFNHSSDIDFQDFMNVYKNVLQNHTFFSYWCYSCIIWSFTFQNE